MTVQMTVTLKWGTPQVCMNFKRCLYFALEDEIYSSLAYYEMCDSLFWEIKPWSEKC